MKSAFYSLNDMKRQNLIRCSIAEFAGQPYNAASINRIIQTAGISKGGLFKYIENKQDLYLYTIERTLESVIQFQMTQLNINSTCYFDRIQELIQLGFTFYHQNQNTFALMVNALNDVTSPCFEQVMDIRMTLIDQHQDYMLQGIDWDQYTVPQAEIFQMMKIVMEGLNTHFMKSIRNRSKNIIAVEHTVSEQAGILFNALRKGVK